MIPFFIGLSIFGTFSFPIIPTIMELATRKFNEIPIYFTNTLFFLTSQLLTIILQVISGYVFDNIQFAGTLIMSMVIYMYVVLLIPLTKIDNEIN